MPQDPGQRREEALQGGRGGRPGDRSNHRPDLVLPNEFRLVSAVASGSHGGPEAAGPRRRYSDSFLKIPSGTMRTASMIQRQNQGV